MQPQDIQPGHSYACQFRTHCFLDSEGAPVQAQLQVGQSHPGTPGEYISTGVIQVRDTHNQRFKLVDTQTLAEFVVDWQDTWDIDLVEWQE